MIERLSEMMLRVTYIYSSGRSLYKVQQIMTIARIYDRAIVMTKYQRDRGLISVQDAEMAINHLYKRAEEEMRSLSNA